MTQTTLKYKDRTDRAYGLAGMIITLVASNNEDYLCEVHLDAPAGEGIVLSHDFGFNGNPRMSAKVLWAQAVKDLRTSAYMILGNIACRRFVRDNDNFIGAREAEAIREAIRTEADTSCSLESDEVDNLFDNTLTYVTRVFQHGGVQDIARSFADTLSSKGSMTASEAIELLSSLGLR